MAKYDIPVIATRPSHHGRDASHAMVARRSSISVGPNISGGSVPPERPVPRALTTATGYPHLAR